MIESDLRAQRWDGTTWVRSIGFANPFINTVTAADVNIFSHWTLAEYLAVQGVPPGAVGRKLCTGINNKQVAGVSPCAATTIAHCNSVCGVGICTNTPCLDSPTFSCICDRGCVQNPYEVFYVNFGTANVIDCKLTVKLPPGVNVLSPITPCAPTLTNISGSIASGFTLIWTDLCDMTPSSGCPSVRTPGSFGIIKIPTEVACCLPKPFPLLGITEIDWGISVGQFGSCQDSRFDLYPGPTDPNSKVLANHSPCEVIEKTDTLIYKINFQNIGTAPARDVVIIDTLDFVNLDASSVATLATSDSATFTLTPSGVATWTFDNINLPDSASDPAGSNGFVMFSVMPNQNIAPNTVVEDRAAIFFDFNPPVITNTIKVTIEGEQLSVDAGSCKTVFWGYAPKETATLTATVSGGTGNKSFLWSTGATTQTIIVNPATTTIFSVSVTYENGCTTTDAVTVEVVDVRCGKNNDKVQVCHFPPGNPTNSKNICITAADVADHLANHGDKLGFCGASDPCVQAKWSGDITQNGNNAGDDKNFDSKQNQVLKNPITILPNPNKGRFTIFIPPDAVEAETHVYIYNVLGEIAYENRNVYKPSLNIDFSTQPQGIYFIKILSGGNLFTDKIIYH